MVATLLILALPGQPYTLTLAAIAVLVVVPLALVIFYSRDRVRLECEACDESRWTDRVPLPVLAVVIMLAFASVTLIANLANPAMTLAGTRITGAPAGVARRRAPRRRSVDVLGIERDLAVRAQLVRQALHRAHDVGGMLRHQEFADV
ncbi:MAG TPA: hypothetical protein VLU46_06985, partial [Thermoanaerobaculia bacterium]|nr:hypothetical protein [Thermoanaerobaculia bacterium]